MSQVDLHIHSTVSDGRSSPPEVVRMAAARGLTVIALADHDSVDGVELALTTARSYPRLHIIPCVEISCDVPEGEIHILGYFIDYHDCRLLTTLQRLRDTRLERAQKMITKLNGLGIGINWPRVRELAQGESVGRPHIAQAMLEKGYVTSIREAFHKYISRDGPAYVEREKMTPEEACALILAARGLPVLAHPGTANEPEAMVARLKSAGMVGVEAYYNNYSPEAVRGLVRLADRLGLIATGGSDYHGLDVSTETTIGGVDVPLEAAERLIALAGQRGLKIPWGD